MVRSSNTHTDKKFVFFPERPDRLCVPPNLPFNGYRGYLSRVSRSRLEVDHSIPSSSKGKNEWRYTSTSLYVVMVLTGTNLQLTGMICSVHLQIDCKLQAEVSFSLQEMFF